MLLGSDLFASKMSSPDIEDAYEIKNYYRSPDPMPPVGSLNKP